MPFEKLFVFLEHMMAILLYAVSSKGREIGRFPAGKAL
jgi:hypothetical protein